MSTPGRQTVAPRRDPATGTWGFIVDIGRAPDGKRRQTRRRGFATKKAAQQALDRLRVTVTDDVYVTPTKESTGQFLTGWLNTIGATIRPSTLFSYRRNIEAHVIPNIGSVPLRGLNAGHLDGLYVQLLADGANRTTGGALSPRTVRYVHTIIHRALRDAVKRGQLVRNVADAATPPSAKMTKAKAKDVWTPAQVGEFLRRSAGEQDRDQALWRFLAATGCRRGEALGLRWRDVDLKAGRATIVQTVTSVNHAIVFGEPKSDAGGRTIVLDPQTVTAITAHRGRMRVERVALGRGKEQADDLVFATLEGEPLHPDSVSKRFDRRSARYKLPHIGVHGLRHTWATTALLTGEHPRVVQARLGHSDVAVTLNAYSHVNPSMDQGAATRVAALFDETGTSPI